jgi:hypothetical protein
VIVFSAAGLLSPLSLPVLCMLIGPPLIFLMGLGLFFSSLCRSTTAATVWSCAIPMFIWFFNPFMVICNPSSWRVCPGGHEQEGQLPLVYYGLRLPAVPFGIGRF